MNFGIALFEATRHGVFAADGTNAQINLGHQSAQNGSGRLAPTLGDVTQTLEVLLQGKIGRFTSKARSNQTRHAFHNGKIGTLELVLLGKIRIEAPSHSACCGGFAIDGELGNHSLRRRELTLAAEGHKHGSRTDGGVEALTQTLVRADVLVGNQRSHALFKRGTFPCRSIRLARLNVNVLILRSTVGIEESTADVDDSLAVPFHAQALFFGYRSDNCCLKVFLVRIADEFFDIFCGKSARHALLAFGDCKLGAIQAFVLLRNSVQIDEQAIAQLADGNRYATSAEVVASFDKTACLAATEQALNLALYRGVALLHFCTGLFHAFNVLRFGGAGCATDAVATSATAQQNNLVARSGLFATNVVSRCCAHYCAHFHALGNIARMVQLVNLAGSKTNLVAVRRIAGSSGGNQLTLGELAFERFRNRSGRIACAGYAHRLINIAAARKRVADSATYTRCRATEGLDFRGVVVGFVLEQEQPILFFAVNVDLALYRAGINFIGLVEPLKAAMRTQVLGANGAHIHQAYRLMLATQLGAHSKILLECKLHRFVVDLDIGKLGAERGVTAMIGPVRINNANLGDSGVAPDFLKMSLEEFDIRLVHGKTALFAELGKTRVIEFGETLDNLYRLGFGHLHLKRFACLERSFARFDWVDNVMLDGSNVRLGKFALQHVHFGATNCGAFTLADELNAFARRISALVKLTGKELDGENRLARRAFALQGSLDLRAAFARRIYLGLAEYHGDALLEQFIGNALDIVAINKAQTRKRLHAQDRLQLVQELPRLDIETGLFLNINARNHESYPSLVCWVPFPACFERKCTSKLF